MPIEQEQAVREMAVGGAGPQAPGGHRLIAELARGDNATVYLVLRRGPGTSTRLLALKELDSDPSEDAEALATFMHEARLAERFDHPNVVRTFESGSDAGRRYILMEYLDGQPLERVLTRARECGKTVSFEWQGAVFCSALAGLAYVHGALDEAGDPAGIVHRDMSPHDVFICYDGQVKVLDFGIAKAIHPRVDAPTGIAKNKLHYMAPEQAAGARVDARANVFSVGVMLWEAAAGRRFWSGVGSEAEILRAMLQGNLSDGHGGAMDGVPEELRDVILRATAFEASKRHSGAEELLTDLQAAGARGRARSSGQAPEPAPSQASRQEIGRFVQELFGDERVRLQLEIKEALRSYTQTVSGKYLVSALRPWSVAKEPLALDAAPSRSDVPPAEARSTTAPPLPVPTPSSVREELLASAEELGLSVSRLQENDGIAALAVVQALDRWRQSVIQHLRFQPAAESATELVDFEPSAVLAGTMMDARASSGPASSVPVGLARAEERAGPHRDRSPLVTRAPRLVAWALLAALTVLGATLWLRRAHRAAEPTRASAANDFPVTAAVVDAPSGSGRPSAESARVIVRASPEEARITFDGALALENPCVVMLRKDGATHTVHVEADGYLPGDQSFDAKGDRTFVLALERDGSRVGVGSAQGLRASTGPVAAPPPPAPSTGAGAAAGDKCYLARPQKAVAAPVDAHARGAVSTRRAATP